MADKFKHKIMIVDDEELARRSLAGDLRARGFDVIEMETGKEVLTRAKSDWPSLIVLDIVLPDISGIEVFEQLRKDPLTKAIPVLLLTAKPDVVKQLASFQEKSDRYVEKPNRLEDMVRAVQEMLRSTVSS